MDRRKFIQLTGLTSLGMLLGVNAMAGSTAEPAIVFIGTPNVHGRHGLYCLDNPMGNNGLTIQRDVLTQNGLDQIIDNRITTIKLIDG